MMFVQHANKIDARDRLSRHVGGEHGAKLRLFEVCLRDKCISFVLTSERRGAHEEDLLITAELLPATTFISQMSPNCVVAECFVSFLQCSTLLFHA